MAFQIDNHTMTIIATDGSPVESHTIKSLTIYSGERIDVIVKADQSIGSYWIRASGLTTVCAYRKAFQLAIVRYEGAGNEEPEGIKRWIPDLSLPVSTECKCVREKVSSVYTISIYLLTINVQVQILNIC